MQQRMILNNTQRLATAPPPSENIRTSLNDPSPTFLAPPAPRGPSYLEPEPYYSSQYRSRSLSRSRSRSYSQEATYGSSRPRDDYYDEDTHLSLARRPSPYVSISWPPTSGSQIDPTDPSGIQGLLIQDSYALIDRKMRELEEMAVHASELEAWVRTLLTLSISMQSMTY